MARFKSRSRRILKYLEKLNQQKSFTDRLTTSTTLQQSSTREEYEANKEYNLLTKDDDQKKISDSATVRSIAATLTGSGVSSKDAIINLASSGLTAGDASIVFIDSNSAKYYISNGSGWYNVALVNADPQWDSAPNSSYTLDSTNPLTIEPIAIDSGGKILSYTATLDNDASQFMTITKDSDNGRIFTLVGESAGAAPGSNSGIVTFRASDGISFVTQNSTINLIYQGTGTLTSSAVSVNEGSSVTFTLPTTGYSDGTTFPYTITGIQSADINEGLTGNMVVSNNSASVSISAVADLTTEGNQWMTFTADGQSLQVLITDTSIAPPEEGRWSARYSGYSGSGTSLPNLGAASSADGTLKSGVSYSSSNQWFEFDGGQNAFVQYPNENGQYPYGDFTIYAIVNINSYGNSSEWDNVLENRLLHLNGATSSVSSRRGGITSSIENGYPEFYYCDTNQAYNVLRSTTRMNLNQWYFLAFTRQKSTGAMKIYVDNTSTPTNTTTKSTLDVKHANFGYEISTGITFGKRVIATFPNTYGFKGKAIEWGIYDSVLSASEMNAIKNKFSEV